jgi:hypothetical protein
VKQLSWILLLIVFLFSSGEQIFGQKIVKEKGILKIGVGFPELINLGIIGQFGQSQIGGSIGWWPPSKPGLLSWDNLLSLSGDFYYHFGGLSKFSDIRPWYLKTGLNYLRAGKGPDNYLLNIPLKVGRDFNIDQFTGISIDAGIAFNLNNLTTGGIPLWPAPGMCIFFRF